MSTAVSLPVTVTYEEFLAQTDDGIKAEWVEGTIIEMSPESNLHQEVTGFLYATILLFVEKHQLGVVRFERFQMKTAPNLPGREPDVMFISNANMARLKNTYLEGPADLAIEVVSLESRERDRGAKFYEYEQGGVQEYWLLDPSREQAEFYQRRDDGLYRLAPPDVTGRCFSAALSGLWLQVDWLWQRPMPPVLDILKAWAIV